MNEEELRELKRQVDGLAGKAKDRRVPPTVPDKDVQELQKKIRDGGLDADNIEYARPVLEVLESTARLSFDVNAGLPPVKKTELAMLKAPALAPIDEDSLEWKVE